MADEVLDWWNQSGKSWFGAEIEEVIEDAESHVQEFDDWFHGLKNQQSQEQESQYQTTE